jgi:hypothetical protein
MIASRRRYADKKHRDQPGNCDRKWLFPKPPHLEISEDASTTERRLFAHLVRWRRFPAELSTFPHARRQSKSDLSPSSAYSFPNQTVTRLTNCANLTPPMSQPSAHPPALPPGTHHE